VTSPDRSTFIPSVRPNSLRALAVAAIATGSVVTAAAGSGADNGDRAALLCPIDRAPTLPVGVDGKFSPTRYSDLEEPTRAYSNLVVACPKCGYAAWAGSFSAPVEADLEAWVKASLAATARRAAEDPVWAYRHHVQILQRRGAPLRERIGAQLFYSYVLKRRRPAGGSEPAVERDILAVRKEVIAMLATALRDEPPANVRARLEWLYLVGELTRLVGDTDHAAPILADCCKERETLGATMGKLACDAADRAQRKDTFEEYRGGMINPSAAAAAAVRPAEPATPAAP